MKISRILHAGYVFESGGVQIAFDPIFENPFSVNCQAYPSVSFDVESIREQKFSAVFISHYHDDHCSMKSLDLLDRETPIYMYCLFNEMFSLLKDLGFQRVYSLQLGDTVSVGPFQITPFSALDADVDCIFQIHADGINILNVVDSWIDPSTLQRLAKTSWDMILWPFQTMREIEVIAPDRAEKASREIPSEWLEQLQVLKPRFLVPGSCQFIQEPWSWYRKAFFPISYSQFQNQTETVLPATKLVRINPGASFKLTLDSGLSSAQPIEWIRPQGEQNVDYEYDEKMPSPPTSEIAQHFSPLNSIQTQKVYEYCQMGLAEKFKTLPASEDSYFADPRIWKLSIFDHRGNEKTFYYQIESQRLRPILPSQNFDWSTEIPLTKFHGALFEGETLTSLYVRINKAQFENVLEDPLLRCLFDGAFAAYQKAQLRRLIGSAE